MATGGALARRSADGRDQTGSKKNRRRKDNNIIWFWGNDCKYEVITDKVDSLGWKIVDDDKKEAKCNLFWVDVSTIHERLRSVLPWQIVNHFPGMTNIARKNRMGQNLNKFQKLFPREFNFYPKTWVLPHELTDFRNQFDHAGNSLGGKVFILKPDTGCQGKGIFLTKSWDNVPTMDNWVAQVYMKKPLLIDGFKFDLRIYVFVTCVKPLRMYLFQDGLVRICSEEYVKPTKANIHMTQMHLTNYAVNKNNANFHQPGEAQAEDGSKRAVAWFMDWIREDWGDEKADRLWRRIGNISVKTLLTILPTLSREYEQSFKSFNNVPLVRPTAKTEEAVAEAAGEGSEPAPEEPAAAATGAQDDGEEGSDDESTEGVGGVPGSCATKVEKGMMFRGSRCFEVLGLDIMIDSKLNPWMIEVNHLPSFGTDSPLDLDIKERLMDEVFDCLHVLPDDEAAYNMHHKAEAEKRLTMDRTTASITKMRDKASVEKEREAEKEKERQDRLRKRRQRDALAAAALQRTLSEERARAGIPDQANGLPMRTETDKSGPKETPYHRLPRIDQIKYHLKEIYTEKCPDKLNKIDRLLERYESREEEFLTFVCEKYSVTIIVPDMAVDDDEEAEEEPEGGGGEEEERGRSRGVSISRESSREEDRSRSVSLDRLPRGKEDSPAPAKHSSSVPPIKSARGPEPPAGGPKTGARFGSRSLSPPASTARRGTSMWKGGDDEELYKLEVVVQHVPDESDLWMQREQRILQSFTRIFPPEPKPSKACAPGAPGQDQSVKSKEEKDAAGGGSDGEESEDGEDHDEEENETPSAPSATKPTTGASPAPVNLLTAPPEKKKMATLNDILVEAFLQDRRQTLRLRAPLANQARPEKDSNSLPELNSKAAWGSAKASKPSGAGWKPPAKPEGSDKKPDKPGPSQAEVANRLYKGLSSSSPHATASNVLASASLLAEPSMADSMVGGPGPLDGGGSLAEGVASNGSVYSAAPQSQAGIAFQGMQGGGYAPSGSVSNMMSTAGLANHRHHQQRQVKQTMQPRPGSLWGSGGNYVLDNSPGTSYIPAQFRGHSIAEQPSNRNVAPAVPAATLRQQVFQFNGGPPAQPRPAIQSLPVGVTSAQAPFANGGGLGITGSGGGNSSSEKYRGAPSNGANSGRRDSGGSTKGSRFL